MQLQMTAPLDIGLEQTDATLGIGQDVIFDLENAEKGLMRNGGLSAFAGQNCDAEIESSEDENEENGDDDVDPEEEGEKKLADLEAELDVLYDAYQEKLKEKDAKFKVKESRKNNLEREEWHGLREKCGDDDSQGSDEDGGWEKMEEAKRNAGDDSSSEESGNEDEEVLAVGQKRRRRTDEGDYQKRPRLITKLQEKAPPPNLAAQIWFRQDLFAGVLGMDNEECTDDEDEIKAEIAEDDGDEMWQHEVGRLSRNSEPSTNVKMQNIDDSSNGSADDMEIVRQRANEDSSMWDASNNNEDDRNQVTIQSIPLHFGSLHP
jgi:AdoMet-dependent rRNA methyltransferase SPB1